MAAQYIFRIFGRAHGKHRRVFLYRFGRAFCSGFCRKKDSSGGFGLTFPLFCGIMKKNFAKERAG